MKRPPTLIPQTLHTKSFDLDQSNYQFWYVVFFPSDKRKVTDES